MAQHSSSRLLNWPNAISVSRVLLVPPVIYGLVNELPLLTSVFFGFIVASDFIDGALARKLGTANGYGTLIDHGADAVVVILLCAFFAFLGVSTWVLPVVICAAFIQYAFDFKPNQAVAPRPSRLGRANGIAYFIFIMLCAVLMHLDKLVSLETFTSLRAGLAVAAWLLVCSSALSIWQRWRF